MPRSESKQYRSLSIVLVRFRVDLQIPQADKNDMTDIRRRQDDGDMDSELRPIVVAQRSRAIANSPFPAITPVEMRARATAEFLAWNHDPEPVAEIVECEIAGVGARLYVPDNLSGDGVLVYLHGGGWVIGDLNLEDAALRHLTRRSGVRIVSLDYRLAPEHCFPAALDDVECVIDLLASEGVSGILPAPTRIGFGGASAGANIAIGAALRARDRGKRGPDFLMLMYGAYAGGIETPSYLQFADGRFGLPRAAMDWFWETYTGGEQSPYSSPLSADLHDLPPVFLNYAELDILRDDSTKLVDRLQEAGVSVVAREYKGAVHGFTQYAKGSQLARRALDEAADALASTLA